MSKARRVLAVVAFCLLVVGMLTGCRAAGERSKRPSKDWSRGIKVGQTTINGRVGLATDATGDNTYLVWIADQEGTDVLRYARIDRAGEVVAEGDLPTAADLPQAVEITLDASGGAHLAWTARLDGEYRLFYAGIDANGGLSAQPTSVSPAGIPVAQFSLSTDSEGGSDLFWVATEGEDAGLYYARLDAAGQLTADNKPLRDNTTDVIVRQDRAGVLRVTWMEQPSYGVYQIFYATFDSGARDLVGSTKVADVLGGTGLVLRGPELGLAGEYAYVLWSVERRGGGLTSAAAQSYYVSFPLGQPELACAARQILIPALNNPAYASVASLGQTRRLAAVTDDVSAVGTFTYLPSTPVAYMDELVSSLAVELQGRTNDLVQIVVMLWSGGEIQGYQIAGKTNSSSLRSALAVDNQNNVHLVWIDTAGFGTYDVYYASTATEARANLNRIAFDDVAAFTLSLGWALTSSISFFPLAFMWIAIPLAVVSIFLFISAEGGLERRSSRIMLCVVGLIYLLLKYLTEPQWLSILQLPSMPTWLDGTLTVTAPLLVAGLAGLVTWVSLRKLEYKSLFRAFVIFAAWDALLTLVQYVPVLMLE